MVAVIMASVFASLAGVANTVTNRNARKTAMAMDCASMVCVPVNQTGLAPAVLSDFAQGCAMVMEFASRKMQPANVSMSLQARIASIANALQMWRTQHAVAMENVLMETALAHQDTLAMLVRLPHVQKNVNFMANV